MVHALSIALFVAAAVGLGVLAVQYCALRRHLAESPPTLRRAPPISILKPLCGVDDDLELNLQRFADLDYPRYEVVLGVKSTQDPAWPVARAAAQRWPRRFRVVLQRGEPGMNPKVNQLITLARAARHDILVISDSNIRAPRGYLAEIAALLEDAGVGLVTHPIVGIGEERLGSLMDNLHLASSVAPGMVAAKRLVGRDIVVGKSMALRRRDVEAMGGFEAVKDVLAEDYVVGLMVPEKLGKKVAVGRIAVENVNQHRSVSEFLSRYKRWSVLQRQMVGPVVYASQALLNPVFLAHAGFALDPSVESLAALGGCCAAKMAIDGACGTALRPGGFRLRDLALVPAKDLIFGMAWGYGFVRNEVNWRGNRLRVLPGTRIAGADAEAADAMQSAQTPAA
jgi:ceramide glucosyltransferase